MPEKIDPFYASKVRLSKRQAEEIASIRKDNLIGFKMAGVKSPDYPFFDELPENPSDAELKVTIRGQRDLITRMKMDRDQLGRGREKH